MFTFNISLSVLNHLGRNLYRNFITVVGEAISNSWDADAKNVWIYIDRDANSFSIKDDGVGMSENDFQNKFLKIGYSKRKLGIETTDSGRPYIGRKGIGKLALLSCAQKISIITKTRDCEFIGGTIDNVGLDLAIDDDLTPQEYSLESVSAQNFKQLSAGLDHGTIILFEGLTDGIRNRVEYIRKLIALYFRFSLIDETFNIYLNDEKISLNELNELASATEFVWQINDLKDPFLSEKISPSLPNIKEFKKLKSNVEIKGFIASVQKPSNLKIRSTDEKVTIDLYVNGRLREKDILKHIPSTRIVESYLYGQVHFNDLDHGVDRFTSSREGILSDDLLFKDFLQEMREIMSSILKDWDTWRIKHKEDGDVENTDHLSKKERKSKELFNSVVDEFIPPDAAVGKHIVEEWAAALSDDAQFNVTSYTECFVSENLLRKYINHQKKPLGSEIIKKLADYKKREADAKGFANISYEIRADGDDLYYLSMDDLSNFVDKPLDPNKEQGLSRDAKVYKPIRDAMAHTSVLSGTAKSVLSNTFENIKARIKTMLNSTT